MATMFAPSSWNSTNEPLTPTSAQSHYRESSESASPSSPYSSPTSYSQINSAFDYTWEQYYSDLLNAGHAGQSTYEPSPKLLSPHTQSCGNNFLLSSSYSENPHSYNSDPNHPYMWLPPHENLDSYPDIASSPNFTSEDDKKRHERIIEDGATYNDADRVATSSANCFVMPKLDGTMADAYNELYTPNPIFTYPPSAESTECKMHPIPYSDVFSQRLQAANSQYLTSSTQPPLINPRERSPFRQNSPFVTIPGSGSAGWMRENQKPENDAYMLQEHPERHSAAENSPRTISPKDAMLDYHETKEESRPLFPLNNPYPPVGDFLSNVSRFQIIEDTLREGEELANVFFSTLKKIKITKASDSFGVDPLSPSDTAVESVSPGTETSKPSYRRRFTPEHPANVAYLRKDRPHCLECRKRKIRCNHGPENSGASKLRTATSPTFVVKQRGLKVLIKNRKESAFGDTGAGQNVISERRREELGLEMRPQPTSFPMGNSKRIFSPGIVDVPIAFEDDPTNVMTVVAHVVHTFAYDLLLGNPFLKATKCLTKFVHRFVPCLFSLASRWSFNLLGETTHRFEGRLGKGIDVLALPDIGSMRNVMNAEWAIGIAEAANFKILTGPENRGWILFPDGTEEATVGQAHTTYTLPDGEVVPVVFELLRDCHVPVVLGQDFVFDNKIYEKYPRSILELDSLDSGDELMPMGYRRNRSENKRTGPAATLTQNNQKDDLDRQLQWNLTYQHGRAASAQEWNEENTRREAYERGRNPNWRPGIPLIQYKPKGSGCMPSVRHSDTSSSVPSRDTTLRDSCRSSSSRESTLLDSGSSSSVGAQYQDDPINKWDTLYLGDFGSDEATQWQEERPT